MRNALRRFVDKAKYLRMRRRGLFVTLWVRLFGGRVGRKLRVGSGFTFKYTPHPGIEIGDNVVIGDRVVFDVPFGGQLIIGDRVKFNYGALVSAGQRISIGADALIAENTSLHDGDHGSKLGKPIALQPVVSEAIEVGAGAWVCAGVVVLKGTRIGAGAIIAANSVARGEIPSEVVAAGLPARVVKSRV